jgi:hypothetical protein
MAEVQQTPAKPSLIDLVFGSRIAQAVGIVGAAFTLFQGLEPFLKFSRFMAYVVNHWRDLTRGMWSWLASFVHLDLPEWVLDLLTLTSFIMLFTVRGMRHPVRGHATWSVIQLLADRLVPMLWLALLEETPRKRPFRGLLFILFIGIPVLLIIILTVPLAFVLTLVVHVGIMWSVLVALAFTGVYLGVLLKINRSAFDRVCFNSERVVFIFIGLLLMNYLALYSHAIESFIEKATQ